MLLPAANAAFLAAGGLLYIAARRNLFRAAPSLERRRELAASLAVGALAVVGFALAHAGMNESWTGEARISSYDWALPALLFAGALLASHALLRAQKSRVDELVLPVAGFLCALGLINLYVWETRDANSYVSTVALPVVREYQESVRRDASLGSDERRQVLRALGPVPNELEFEDGSRSATVLEPQWVAAYNGAARRYADARSRHPQTLSAPVVRELQVSDALSRQVLAAVLALLSVPLLLASVRYSGRARVAGTAIASRAVGVALLLLLGASLLTSRSPRLPALLEVGGHGLTVFEPLKLALVLALALGLAALAVRPFRRADTFALAAAAATIAVMLWRDLGAGLALLAVAALMISLVAGPRWRLGLAVAAVLGVAVGPAATRLLDASLPHTARVRMEMWADPWGAYERAQLENKGSAVLRRIMARSGQEAQPRPIKRGDLRAISVSSTVPQPPLGRYISRIEHELRWRLEALDSDQPSRRPLIPADPIDSFLLGEAEQLWADLGGFRAAGASAPERAAFRDRLEYELDHLRREARLSEQDRGRRSETAPDNFQLQRSLYALREGRAFGVGFGRGRPEMVPGLTEDVAIASIGEALGAAGVLLVGLFVLLLVGRGLEVAKRQASPVLGLIGVGLAALLGLQALISLGGISGLLPFTGLTFPFLSRSGTALVANFLLLAMLLAVGGASARIAPTRERRAPRLLQAAGFPAAFVLALASVTIVQLTGRSVASGAVLAGLPGSSAPFLHASDQWDTPTYRAAPGGILDRKGRVLAETRSLGANRTYPDAALARSLGHTLLRLDGSFREELSRPERPRLAGPSLVTTIDSDVQRALDAAMEEGAIAAGLPSTRALRGAVVLVDARNGGIVALQSRPTFSPTELADQSAWTRAEAEERRAGFPYRYLNRVVDGFYPPGSIFKTVTAAGALERGLHSLHSRDFDYRRGNRGRRTPDGVDQFGYWHQIEFEEGAPITDGNHPHLDVWNLTLADAYAWSCNVAFAELGLELGAADLVGFARRFGFERPIAVPGLGTSTSTLDNDAGRSIESRFLARNDSNLARTAFGQGQARVTPLQMALVPAAIANGGKVPQPRLVAGWRLPDGRWLHRTRPRVLSDTRLSRIALEELRRMMWWSVTYGWARTAAVNPTNRQPGVAGKTGSAEWSEKRDISHSWFIGYFPAEKPRLALAVVIERGGSGPTVAARIARRIFSDEAVQAYVREANG